MLAHAMAHIATRAVIANQATTLLIFMGGSTDSGIRPLIPIGFRQCARANELQADRIAVSVAADSGFDPRALLAFIERTYKDEKQTRIESALPPRDQRLAALRRAIDDLPAHAYEPREGFERIQEALRAAGIK
jgi:predicted Zn-dependent protease